MAGGGAVWRSLGFGRADGLGLALQVAARGLNACAMYIALQRFAVEAMGEYSYLLTTTAAVSALCNLGLDLSATTLFSRDLAAGRALAPSLAAGGVVVSAGALLAGGLVAALFGLHLAAAQQVSAALVVWDSVVVLLAAALVNGLCYALRRLDLAGVAALANAAVFVALVGDWRSGGSGQALLGWSMAVQGLSVAGLLTAVLWCARSQLGWARFSRPRFRRALRRFGRYALSQGPAPILTLLAAWFVQDRLVRLGGAGANAAFGAANQLFNLVSFLPTLLAPLLLRRLAEADESERPPLTLAATLPFLLLATGSILAVAFGLALLAPHLPSAYAGLGELGVLAAAAAGLQMLRLPFGLYFASDLRAAPEVAASLAAAVATLAFAALTPALTDRSASLIRLATQGLALVLVAAWFARDAFSRRLLKAAPA